MKDCKEVVDFCLDYLEGELPVPEHARLSQHLSQCTECVNFVETYRRTPEISRQTLALEMPVQLKEAVKSFLRTRCTK